MANLTDIEHLEKALDRELTDDEKSLAEYYIQLVSSYIISYTGLVFSEDESESPGGEVTQRAKADYYGIITLPGAVSNVVSVKYWSSDVEHGSWQWDGLNEVYGLGPMETVDITYITGSHAVPDDLRNIATEAAKRLFDSPSGQETGPLTRYRVGDVEESYRAVDISMLGGLFNDLEKLILDDYRQTMTTWHLGFAQQDNRFRRLPPAGDNSIVE